MTSHTCTSEVQPVGGCGLDLAPSLDYTCMRGMQLPRDHPQPPLPQMPQQPPQQMPQPLQQMPQPPQQTSQQLTSQLHGWASGQQSPAPEPEHNRPRRSKARAPAPTTASAPPAASQHAASAPAACAPSAEPPIAEQAAALPPPESAPLETSPPWAASQKASGAPSSVTSGANVVVLSEVLMRKFAKRRAEDALEANADSGTVEPTTPKRQCKEEQSESPTKLRTMSWRPNVLRKESEQLAAKEEEDLLAKDPLGDTARCFPSEV